MELQLNAEQVTTLRDLLEAAVRDLSYEIANTDNSQFKAGLRERDRVIRSILDDLRAPTAAPPA